MTAVVCSLYGLLLVVAALNLLWMRQPKGRSAINFEVMVPARNEEQNLPFLLPPLIASGVRVTVFDDASTDATASVAKALGARTLSRNDALPDGWTGKTRACHELSLQAAQEWTVFLDADTRPSERFAEVLAAELASMPASVSCVTGFPKMLPGCGLEPLYLGWVPWILLSTNPFGLVEQSNRGHNQFTNGQFTAWRTESLRELRPFEAVRGEVLEDIKIGRFLARQGEAVVVLNVSNILSVRMYDRLGQSFAGMSKNAGHIASGPMGSFFLAAFLAFVGFGWVLAGSWMMPLYLVLVATKIVTDRVVRYPFITAPFIPLTCLAGAVTILWSTFLRRKGRIEWKGRTYG